MLRFLKKIMNINDSKLPNDVNSMHRILKTDIKKEPTPQEEQKEVLPEPVP